MSCFEKFHDLLRERGFRFTPQREAILQALHRVQSETTTAEQLHAMVSEAQPAVDLATVYRTLEMLADIEFVKSIDSGRKVRLWQFVGAEHPHPHLQCRSCGKLSEIDHDALTGLAAQLRDLYGFAADVGQVTIPGLCPECRDQA